MTIEWTIPDSAGSEAVGNYSRLHLDFATAVGDLVGGFASPNPPPYLEDARRRVVRDAPGNLGIRVRSARVDHAVHLVVRRSDLYIIGIYREENRTVYWFRDTPTEQREYHYTPNPPAHSAQIPYEVNYDDVMQQAGVSGFTAFDMPFDFFHSAVENLANPEIDPSDRRFARAILLFAISLAEASRFTPIRMVISHIFNQEVPPRTQLNDDEAFYINNWNRYGRLLVSNMRDRMVTEDREVAGRRPRIGIAEALAVIAMFKLRSK
ncbi:ribosome-inactivating family protein [Streptomyces celluloflavus]|uniref:ribosome-inactivating family protein n=1 Tax=Streptomyces celluloflavus TaxID=58344 RepID=UPI003669443B